MEKEKKPKKRFLRLLSVLTVVLLLAFMAVPAFAAENDGYIVAGIYRFNDVLTESDIELNADIDFTVVVTAFGMYEVVAHCDNITVNAELNTHYEGFPFWYNTMRYNVAEVDPPSEFLTTPIQLLMYQTSYQGQGKTTGIWETFSYSEGIKTITILNDTEVSAEFYEWFTANTVPVNSFRESVTSGLTVVIDWVGTVVSSLFSGELSGLLPIVAIPVAVTLLVLAIYFIRRSIWGA